MGVRRDELRKTDFSDVSSGRRLAPVHPGDVLLLCSDGLWAGLTDDELATLSAAPAPAPGLREALAILGERALLATAPFADNTTAAAVRWLGP